jgi:hypothetical protein
MEKPEISYDRGWSRGKEKFQDKYDTLKGSFYADPLEEVGNGKLAKNEWPDEKLSELERNFKELGKLMY